MLERLKRAGLDAIAEAPVDLLRDAEDDLGACLDAGLPVRCLSLQSPIESDGRSSWLIHLRDLLKKFPLIDTVNPLSREQSIAVPTTGYEDVRAVALARLVLPSVKNIQVDWAQYGPKLAQVALTFGANDLDRVSTADDASLGKRRTSVEDVRRNIAAAGFTPVERTFVTRASLARSWRGLVSQYEAAGLRARCLSQSVRCAFRRAREMRGAAARRTRSISG